MKNKKSTDIYYNELADDNQRNLHTHFSTEQFLGNPKNVNNLLEWTTFFRRNLHRFAIDYLKIGLHLYQVIWLYLMGINRFFVVISSRATAKSWIIALYACCKCILYPQYTVILASSTRGQSKLLIQDKIENDLMGRSPVLRKEIKNIVINANDMHVKFKNGSVIRVVTANEKARGNRSNCIVREEFRQIKKSIDDAVLSPFQILRQAEYLQKEEYSGINELHEEATDIYISSSWFDNNSEDSWMWNIVDQAYDNMINGKDSCLLAFDESVSLKHKIKSQTYYQTEKKKQDLITWRLEFMNERLKENRFSFFSLRMLTKNQVDKQVFYPRRTIDFLSNKKNKYAIPKQYGEIRIVSCDMAFVEKQGNDNSIFTCMRLLPETKTYTRNDLEDIELSNGYRRIVSYMESVQGGDTAKQARRIRQLFEDFEADYIVLDTRNAGIAVYDNLAKVMYDEKRKIEYSPLSCMNDENIANRIKSEGSIPCIYAINASQKLNSDIAIDFRRVLSEEMIEFLIPFNLAMDEILSQNNDYISATEANDQIFYERPFLETQAFINECIGLTYEKKEQTGAIVLRESATNHKDRYSSCSYGSWFGTLLEKDLFSGNEEYEYSVFVN